MQVKQVLMRITNGTRMMRTTTTMTIRWNNNLSYSIKISFENVPPLLGRDILLKLH